MNNIQHLHLLTTHAFCCDTAAGLRIARHNEIVKKLRNFLVKCLPSKDSEVIIEHVLQGADGADSPPIDIRVRNRHQTYTMVTWTAYDGLESMAVSGIKINVYLLLWKEDT